MANLRKSHDRKSCLGCIHFQSYAQIYEDSQEDHDVGNCVLDEYKDVVVGDDKICDEHFEKQNMEARQEITDREYQIVITECRNLFEKKTRDYGTAWRILRLSSITDQIWIKAARIRSIQESKEQKVADPIRGEFVGILNYSVIALIQLGIESGVSMELSPDEVLSWYDSIITKIITLHHAKNSDYGEAWRDMRISSMVDLILQKLLRIKQIENNQGKTIASEGVDAGYQDIVNYSVFCLIRMNEGTSPI